MAPTPITRLLVTLATLVVLGAIVAGVYFLGLPKPETEKYTFDEMPKPVYWMQVSEYSDKFVRKLAGVLQAENESHLSFEVSGKIAALHYKPGETFKRNDVLAELDTQNFEIVKAQREGEVASAKAALAQAVADFKRAQRSITAGAISQQQFDASKAAYEAAKNQLKVAEGSLELAIKQLADTRLIAPFAGVVAAKNAEVSQNVLSGQAVFVIQGDGGLKVSTLVPETFINQISLGQVHQIAYNGDARYPARVTEVGQEASVGNAYPVKLSLEEPDTPFRPGMTVEVVFEFDHLQSVNPEAPSDSRIFELPLTSLLPSGQSSEFYVYVYDPQTQTVSRKSFWGNEASARSAIVSSNELQDGDIIITKGGAFLHDGQKVKLIDNGVSIYQD